MSDVFRLCDMTCGMKARVISVDTNGSMRRRFFDIGLVKGTMVECVGVSPLGDPKAYLIRGAVMAVRNEDCADISVAAAEE